MRWLLLGITLILVTAFLLEYKVVGQAVYGDGRYYFAITRSLYFAQNIDVSDEMAHQYSPESNNKPASFSHDPAYAGKTKIVTNSFSLGVSLFWLPFYFLADLLLVLLQSFGFPFVRNGYGDIYQIVLGLGNIGFVVLGIGMLYSILERYFTKQVTTLTLLLIVLATNLFYYGSLDVINSHPLSLLLTTVLLYFFLEYRKKPALRYVFYQAFIVGLLATNRTQDGIFILLPLISCYIPRLVGKTIKRILFVFLTVFLGYLPQLVILTVGQGHLALLAHTDQAFHMPQHFMGILFDPKLGVMWYMPITLIGVIGLWSFRKKQRTLSNIFLTIVLLHYAMIASWGGWHQASYTMRYFISSLPLLAFGIASLLTNHAKHLSRVWLYCLIILFVMHQMVMILSFKLFWQDSTMVGSELSRSGKVKEQLKHILMQPLP